MDGLSELLDGPRANGAFLLRAVMGPPWSIRIEDRAPLSVTAVVSGDAWVIHDDGDAVRLGPGELVLMRGPDPYTIADGPDTPRQIVVGPGQVCTTIDGADVSQAMLLGVRTWGNDLGGSTVMLCGTYESTTAIGNRLLASLPTRVVVPAEAFDSPLVDFLAAEIVKEAPGQAVVLDRLLDLLVIEVVRTWFSRPDVEAPAWYGVHSDPVVGRALSLIQNDPGHPWSVAELARECGVSRAAFARRFADLVGQPPMTFLTEWRMTLAADLLVQPDATIAAVAEEVGYSSAFALSTAFKRTLGMSPHEHRLAHAAAARGLVPA